MRTLLFWPRFVQPIRSGLKRQTVRQVRKHQVKPGERISLRYWSHKPYRGPQAEIVPPVVCTAVEPVKIEVDVAAGTVAVWVGGDPLTADEVDQFVRDDGFTGVADYLDYLSLSSVPGGVFLGVRILWTYQPQPQNVEGGGA